MNITPDELLTWYAARTARDGYTCPLLDSSQARHTAEVALDRLGAACGLTRPTPPPPPQQITASPAVDSPTTVMPIYRPDPTHAQRLYQRGMPR